MRAGGWLRWHCDLFMASRPLLLPSDMGWSALDGNTHGANAHNIKHTFYAGKKHTSVYPSKTPKCIDTVVYSYMHYMLSNLK